MTKKLLFAFLALLLVLPAVSAYTYYGSNYGDSYDSYSYNSQRVSGDGYQQNVKTVNYDKNAYTIDRGNYQEKVTSVTRTVRETTQPNYYGGYNSWRPANYIRSGYYQPTQVRYVNTYTTPYYYQPRWDSYNQHYNWNSY